VLLRTRRQRLPWESLLAFVRLVSNPRPFARPESSAEAWAQVWGWLGAPPVGIPSPTERHLDVLPELLPDAHLAALAIEHGLGPASTDHDFARFERLRRVNPLAG